MFSRNNSPLSQQISTGFKEKAVDFVENFVAIVDNLFS